MRPPGRPRKDAEPVHVAPRTCELCGTIYTKPANQPWARWLARRFCTLACCYRRSAA